MEIYYTVILGRNKLNSTETLQIDMTKASILVAFLSVMTNTCQGTHLGGRIYCGTVHPGWGGTEQEQHGCGSRTIRLLSPMSMDLGMLIHNFLFFPFLFHLSIQPMRIRPPAFMLGLSSSAAFP